VPVDAALLPPSPPVPATFCTTAAPSKTLSVAAPDSALTAITDPPAPPATPGAVTFAPLPAVFFDPRASPPITVVPLRVTFAPI